MSTVIAYLGLLYNNKAPFWFIGICIATPIILFITFLVMTRFSNKIGSNGLQVVTSIMGLITASIAVQLVTAGIYGLFPMIGS